MANELTSNEFAKILISTAAKIQAAQEVQANMIAGLMAPGSLEKRTKIMELYYQDVDTKAIEYYQKISGWLNSTAKID